MSANPFVILYVEDNVAIRESFAEVLATSCPYCITNFTDSSLDLADHEKVEVKDLTEIIAEVI